MNNQEENRIAHDAARDAGIKGRDAFNQSAMSEFIRDFHNVPRYERKDWGYWGILSYAQQWWSMNSHRFQNNNQRYRR